MARSAEIDEGALPPHALGDTAEGRRIRDRAVHATQLSVTISDPAQPDNPLIWVNEAFTRLTNYTSDEALGRNCRFLQGSGTNQDAIGRVRTALSARESVTEVVLNYRKDGTAFWNEVSITPVLDESGEVINFVGIQSDVTERVLVEQERQTALGAAEEARADLQLLTETTTWMTGTLDADGVATRLARSVVPALADFGVVYLQTPGSRARVAATAHRDSSAVATVQRAAELLSPQVGGKDPVSQVLSGAEAVLLADLPDEPPDLLPGTDAVELYRELQPRSLIVVPLPARGRVGGAVALCTELPYGRRYAQRDLRLAKDLGGRAGLAVDNARIYSAEHTAAETLQRSLFSRVPAVDGVQIAARYRAGAQTAQVGGDWYDLLSLPDGAVGVAVGDVVGHDLHAAADMGQLRGVLRSYAWEGLRPHTAIDRSDGLIQGLGTGALATAVYARLETASASGGRRLCYCNAGHPPVLLRTPDGYTRYLDEVRTPMLGALPVTGRQSGEALCPPGSVLLFFTDGLTDIAGRDPEQREQRLLDLLADQVGTSPVEEICDRVLAELAPMPPPDDVALLAVRVSE